jgi:hypothetical protein
VRAHEALLSTERQMNEEEESWKHTKNKYDVQCNAVRLMRVKSKRNLFFILRSVDGINEDTFLPAFGLFCGEFAVFQVISEHIRKEKSKT